MNILKIITELRAERARLEEAILALEKVVLQQKPRRGRPPGWTKRSSLAAPQSDKAASDSKSSSAHLTASMN
jgi:hypothetical protein